MHPISRNTNPRTSIMRSNNSDCDCLEFLHLHRPALKLSVVGVEVTMGSAWGVIGIDIANQQQHSMVFMIIPRKSV